MAALYFVQTGVLGLDEDVNHKLTSWKVPDNEYTQDSARGYSNQSLSTEMAGQMLAQNLYLLSVDHEMAGRGPKIGERAYARSPIFGYSLSFREVLIIEIEFGKLYNYFIVIKAWSIYFCEQGMVRNKSRVY